MKSYINATERRIATALVDGLLSAGYALSIDDGEEITVRDSTDRAAILAALGSTDQDIIRSGSHWVLLIWGNGEDLVSDYGETDAPWQTIIEQAGR